MAAVRLADEMFETTQDVNASIAMIRAAFKGCPACPLTRQGMGVQFGVLSKQSPAHLSRRSLARASSHISCAGAWSWTVFNVDSFEDRQMLYGQILPEVYHQNVKDVLWVGVHPYTLRYEYLFGKQGITMTSLEVGL